jgi:hypothetical protein
VIKSLRFRQAKQIPHQVEKGLLLSLARWTNHTLNKFLKAFSCKKLPKPAKVPFMDREWKDALKNKDGLFDEVSTHAIDMFCNQDLCLKEHCTDCQSKVEGYMSDDDIHQLFACS